MTLGIIEFNDQSLLIQAEDETRYSEPGFARLTDQGIETGEKARLQAWLQPMHIHNQHWCHLNQTPLAQQHQFARHHGDIAFAQLQALWRQAGSPDELILLPPGSFTHAQLSLLLGLAQALPAKVLAVIDSALAANLEVSRDTLFIDIHQHQSVVAVCGVRDGMVQILDEEIFPGVGMGQIHNSVARYISDSLIESYRFDPLHSSRTEQKIFDQLPHWMTRLAWEQEISITLESDKGELPCIINREKISLQVNERLSSMFPFMDEWPDCDIVLSHHSGVVAPLVERFASGRVARMSAGTRRVLEYRREILEQANEIERIRSIKRFGDGNSSPVRNGTELATHILYGELALPLNQPVSIRNSGGGLELSNELDPEASISVVRRQQKLEVLNGAADDLVPTDCLPGDSFVVDGKELRLIRVAG